MMASFAERVTPSVAAVLQQAESTGLRGDTQTALELLRSTAAALGPDVDDDRVAIGEMAVVVSAWALRVVDFQEFLEDLAGSVSSPEARGALLFQRGRTATAVESSEFLTRALDEFTIAGDLRGRAVTLSEMCWVRDDGVSPDYRVRLGREAMALAERLEDPWAIAFCGGRLAATATYYDLPDCMAHWKRAAAALPLATDPLTSEITSLNQHNWVSTAFQHGDYRLARQLISEGKMLARGSGWTTRFDASGALVSWRTGDLAQVEAQPADTDNPFAAIAYAACELERRGKLSTHLIDHARARIRHDLQLEWLAGAVQAELRVARREPHPLRDLPAIVDQAQRMGLRFGWEDAVLVLARHDPRMARASFDKVADIWPSYPRGQLVRTFVTGLIAERKGFADLLAAAEGFDGIGEPVTAGQALHAAAGVAPTLAEGNRLRYEAITRFQRSGADRSLAAVVRERRLHRGDHHVPVPESQRNAASAALTPRERDVAALAAQGYTAEEIGQQLHISVGTARNHLLKVREKFGGVPKRRLTSLLSEGPQGPET